MASVDYLETEQWPGMKMRMFFAPARELVRVTKVSVWKSGSGKRLIGDSDGYQRRLNVQKVRGIVNDLLGSTHESPLPMPSALILSARDGAKTRNKKLVLPGGPDWHVVDAQHRLEAFRTILTEYPGQKSIIDMPLPVVLLDKWSALDEGWMFWVVNTKATRIDTSLGLVIFSRLVQEKKERGSAKAIRILACIELTEEVMTAPGTPWSEIIMMPDDSQGRKGRLGLSFASAVKSFGSYIWPTWPWITDSVSEIAEKINMMWSSWIKVVPQAVTDRLAYAMLGAAGFNAINYYGTRLLAALWPVEQEQMDLVIQEIAKNLGGSDFWLREGKFRHLFTISGHKPKLILDALLQATPQRIQTKMGENPTMVKAPFS